MLFSSPLLYTSANASSFAWISFLTCSLSTVATAGSSFFSLQAKTKLVHANETTFRILFFIIKIFLCWLLPETWRLNLIIDTPQVVMQPWLTEVFFKIEHFRMITAYMQPGDWEEKSQFTKARVSVGLEGSIL